MEITEFFTLFKNYFRSEEFVFFDREIESVTAPKVPTLQRLGTFGYEMAATDHRLSEIMAELAGMADEVSIRLKSGAPVLALALRGEGVSDEQIIGRFMLFEKLAPKFKTFSLTYAGGLKRQVWFNVFTVFETTKASEHFQADVQPLCLRSQFWNKIYIRPWGIDIESQRVYRPKTLLPEIMDFWSADTLQSKFFAAK